VGSARSDARAAGAACTSAPLPMEKLIESFYRAARYPSVSLSLSPLPSLPLSLSLFLFILLPLVSRLRFVARQVSSESGSRGDSLGEAGWAEWNGKYSYPANLLPSAGDTIAARRDKQGREGEEATEFYTFKHPYV